MRLYGLVKIMQIGEEHAFDWALPTYSNGNRAPDMRI